VLVHGADAVTLRIARAAERDGLAVVEHGAERGGEHARHYVDERGLAGAIVAEQAMHLAGIDVEIDVVEREVVGEAARHAVEAHQWNGGQLDFLPRLSARLRMRLLVSTAMTNRAP